MEIRLVVISYIHKVRHSLKISAKRFDIPAISSAPNKLGKLYAKAIQMLKPATAL